MTHDRPYRRGVSTEQALEEIKAERERQFDPDAVDAFAVESGHDADNSMHCRMLGSDIEHHVACYQIRWVTQECLIVFHCHSYLRGPTRGWRFLTG